VLSALENEVNKIKAKAKKKNLGFALVESRSEKMAVVVVNGVPAALLMFVGKDENMILHLKVNLSKWLWAYEEGFEGQEVFENLGEEIFTLTSETNLLKYLKLN